MQHGLARRSTYRTLLLAYHCAGPGACPTSPKLRKHGHFGALRRATRQSRCIHLSRSSAPVAESATLTLHMYGERSSEAAPSQHAHVQLIRDCPCRPRCPGKEQVLGYSQHTFVVAGRSRKSGGRGRGHASVKLLAPARPIRLSSLDPKSS